MQSSVEHEFGRKDGPHHEVSPVHSHGHGGCHSVDGLQCRRRTPPHFHGRRGRRGIRSQRGGGF
jgi:hypothetical protein